MPNTELITQRTTAMTRKQFWTLITGGSITLAVWALSAFAGVELPGDVVATIVTMAGAAVGYFVRDRV